MFPLPQDQPQQGFEPNAYIRALRRLAAGVIVLLRLNGNNRFSNELIQILDPKVRVTMPSGETLLFRTGHGRLLWRARTFQSEEPMLVEWIKQVSFDDCFYDVGANVGSYSIYAAKRGVRTIACEPELSNLQVLYDNVFLNDVSILCTPLPIGLGESTNLDVLFLKSVSKGDALHSIGRKSVHLRNTSVATPSIHVLVAKLDDVIEIFQLPRPTKLKIDVDGNELQVLRGAMNTLDDVEDVYLEVDTAREESHQAVELLEGKGFRVVQKESIARIWSPNQWNYLFSRTAG